MAENKSKLQRTQSNPKMTQLKECPSDLEFIRDSEDTKTKTKLQFTESPEGPNLTSESENILTKAKIQRKKSNSKMIQFTESISAINSMTASVGLIRAKNAFLRKLSKDVISQKDIQREGEKEWRIIEESYTPILKWNDVDFTDLEEKRENTKQSSVTTPGQFPPPPPPPPPPPFTGSTTSRMENSSSSNSLFKDQLPKRNQTTRNSETLPNKYVNRMTKLHWRPIPKGQLNTLWTQLPESVINEDELKVLFQVKEKKLSASDIQNKPKELTVLDKKRSNQINIGTKNLPSLGSLKTIILKMDDNIMSRDGVEKLQALVGTSEEIMMIKEAQKNNPGVPLGHAEQFLLMLHSISGLECRLKLWAFKLDFEVMEEDITYPLKCLKDGIERIKTSQTFSLIMSYILAVGNMLNRTDCEGFQLEYLSKLKDVKDTDTKKTLLHHIVRNMLDSDSELTDLAQEFVEFRIVSRTNFEEVQTNLESMEEECKRSIGYLKLAARYDSETHQLVHDFLIGATERILTMKRIYKLVLQKHAAFLDWLGISNHLQNDYNPMKVATILINFALDVNCAKTQLIEKNRNSKKTRSETVSVTKSYSEKSTKRKEKKKVCAESKSLDDSLLDKHETTSCLMEFLVKATTESKTKVKRRTVSRQSSTASEYRYSRTVSRESTVIE